MSFIGLLRRRLVRGTVLATAGVLVASTTLTGCATGADVCTGSVENVHKSSGTSTDMVGKARGQCTAAVTINGYVAIEVWVGGSTWYNYKRTSFTLVTTPGVQFTRQAATQCARGTFRTHGYVTGTLRGQSQTRISTSGSTSNPCA